MIANYIKSKNTAKLTKSILYIQFTNPTGYPPLEYSSRILADSGWSVYFLGTKSSGASNALTFESHSNIHLKLLSFCPPGIFQKLHYLRFWLLCICYCFLTRAKVVYASDSWSYPVAYSLSWIPHLSVIMHEHDTPNVTRGQINKLIAWFRKKLAKRAMLTICPQPERAAKMEHEIAPKELRVVYNCPRRQPALSAGISEKKELRLWFHGSIVPTQLPACIIDAMAMCTFPVRLDIAGYETLGHPGYVSKIQQRAHELGLGNQFVYHGAIPSRQELLRRASQCDLGLSLFAKTFREPMVGASNKPFDYLSCGLALLVPDTKEWNTFFVEEGCAIACDSEEPQSISQTLEWCWENSEKLQQLSEKGQSLLLSKWNYESQFQPVLDRLQELA